MSSLSFGTKSIWPSAVSTISELDKASTLSLLEQPEASKNNERVKNVFEKMCVIYVPLRLWSGSQDRKFSHALFFLREIGVLSNCSNRLLQHL